ncbi:MAG: hypothetical protein P4L20_10110 [Acidimicrobiales bacterium]|nr:hypothetical protein [Acidimicrobiales bacterium]
MIASVGLAASPSALAKARVRSAGPGAAHAQKVKHHKVKNGDPTIYDSIVDPSPGNLPSWAFQATQTSEFGNQVTFAGTARVLDNVVVQMASWTCGNLAGGASCATAPGATFSEPITLNIYDAPALGNSAPEGTLITPGSLIATDTQTFNIPYRPSADPNYATDCLPDVTMSSPISDFVGTWYDSAIDQATGSPVGCLNGLLANVTFDFGHVSLPNNVVYGIAYNTTTWGYHPYGNAHACDATTSCGYDGLNVALTTTSTPSVGGDPDPGSLFHNAAGTYGYCDGGTSPGAGVGIFRLDSPGPVLQCWEPGANDTPPYYIPAVQFNALASPSPTITSLSTATVVAGTPFSFTVTSTGVPTPSIRISGKLPKGLVLSGGSGTETISGTALRTDRNKVTTLIVTARNAKKSVAKQHLLLTLTGGKS